MNRKSQNPEMVFKVNAKTFALAARFLSRARYDAVARGYYFCRYLDDLADAAPAGCNNEKLLALRDDFIQGVSDDPVMADLLVLQQVFGIPANLVMDFIDALIADQWPRHLQTQDELVRFCYGVASTVGLMMCHLFGVKNPRAYPFAVDLGVAMQMTNICRDILEDAERERVYLPAEMLEGQATALGIAGGDSQQRAVAFQAAVNLLGIADEYYASAQQGYGFLPVTVRQAIKVAARLYQAIGDKVVAQPEHYWQRRTVVAKTTKCRLIGQLLGQRITDGSSTLIVQTAKHRPRLHKALDTQRFGT
jgi:phytoene synthase